jgi:hypothetical protein
MTSYRGGRPLSRLNPLHDITDPMNRLEQAMSAMKDEMGPIQTLPAVLASLQRVEQLLERLVAIQEAEAEASGIAVKPAPASRRAAPRKRAASA